MSMQRLRLILPGPSEGIVVRVYSTSVADALAGPEGEEHVVDEGRRVLAAAERLAVAAGALRVVGGAAALHLILA